MEPHSTARGLFHTVWSGWGHSQRKQSEKARVTWERRHSDSRGQGSWKTKSGSEKHLVGGHRPLCAPVPRIQTGAHPHRPRSPQPSQVHSHLVAWASAPGPVLPTARAWTESHPGPPFFWRERAAPGFCAVFCPGSRCTAGGVGGDCRSHALRCEWKAGRGVGRS